MNVASPKNCQRLYKLSGWKKTAYVYRWYTNLNTNEQTEPELFRANSSIVSRFKIPAYELGYLLRRIETSFDDYEPLELFYSNTDTWVAAMRSQMIEAEASTPEDAVATLAYSLFKERVLTK